MSNIYRTVSSFLHPSHVHHRLYRASEFGVILDPQVLTEALKSK